MQRTARILLAGYAGDQLHPINRPKGHCGKFANVYNDDGFHVAPLPFGQEPCREQSPSGPLIWRQPGGPTP